LRTRNGSDCRMATTYMSYSALRLVFEPFPILRTSRLMLRKVSRIDVHEIFFLRSDPRIMKYLDKAAAHTVDDAVTFIDKIESQEKSAEAIMWAIVMNNEEKLIGTIGFWNMTPEHYRAEIGYALYPDKQGKGIMQEAMEAVLNYGFRVMHLHSVEANVNPGNAGSIKLLERNGFVREGYYRENYFFDGRFLDSAIYSLLAPSR